MNKRQIGILLMMLCMIGVSSATSILWCSDRPDNDQPFVDLLTAEGYTVDRLASASDMTQAKVDLANTYDLVIVGRDASSGSFASNATEVAIWNSIAKPLICMNGYLWRNNRWKWLNGSTNFENTLSLHPVLTPGNSLYDALFSGVMPDENGNFGYSNTAATIVPITSAGNGTLVGSRASTPDSYVFVAYWSQGVEYYTGSGAYAGGPRLALPGGGGIGQYNLTADGSFIFLNAVYYMSGATFNRKPIVNAGYDRIANANETIALDAAIFDSDSTPTISWTQISGPGTATFQDAAVVDPNVTFDAKGDYVLKITAVDGISTVFDQMTVTVRDNADNALIAHWNFDNLPDPNTLIDVTGNGFTGICHSSMPSEPNVAAGNMIGNPSVAADLTVNNAYWEVPNSYDNTDPNFNDLATGMSVAVWVKISDASVTYPNIIGNGLDGWRLGINVGSYNLVSGSGLEMLTVGINPYDGVWHHVVGILNGVASQAHIYVDGQWIVTKAVQQGALFAKGTGYPLVQIANRGDGDRPFKGYIDDIRLYNYPLSDGEIASLASEGNRAVSVTAGADQTIVFKGVPVQLEGQLPVDDGVPAPATLAWTVTGFPVDVNPASVIFSDAAIAAPTVTFPNVEGTYRLRLTANDTEYTDFDEVNITLSIPTCADVIVDGLGKAGDISGPDNIPDCHVDIYDFAALASDWLNCNDPEDVNCEWAYQQ